MVGVAADEEGGGVGVVVEGGDVLCSAGPFD